MLDNIQIRSIYALGAAAGMKGIGRDDGLHALVYEMTGQESIKRMDNGQYLAVRNKLLRRQKLANREQPLKKNKDRQADTALGMMTREQIGIAWRLIYRLMELDPSDRTAGVRMCGAIKKILGMSVDTSNPFKWISTSGGSKLIENLKRYVRSAERKALRAQSG